MQPIFKKNHPGIQKLVLYILEVGIFIILMWFYSTHSVLLAEPSKPYQTELAQRLQTDALLQGRLSLSPHPFGYVWDYAWSKHGVQQGWGMGVPLLRLPFEWIAKQCGAAPFPDRLTLMFYLSLMIIIFSVALRMLLGRLGKIAYSTMEIFFRWYLVAWVMFSPGMSSLIQTYFNVYEETIFYSCILSHIILALFWVYFLRPYNWIFFILCLVAGFAWLVRPTLIFYGFVTFILAAAYAYQRTKKISLVLTGLLYFLLGIVVLFGFNYLRFGTPSEFGYSLQISWCPYFDYAFKFGYPYSHEPFFSAAKELIGQLFFHNLWVSSTIRWRECNFSTFNISYLAVLISGIVILFYFILRQFLRKEPLTGKTNSIFSGLIVWTLYWGLICFGLLFYFFLHTAAICSRYLYEFSAAFHAIFIVIILSVFFSIISRSNLKRHKSCLFLFIIVTMPFFYFDVKTFLNFDYQLYKKDNYIYIGNRIDVEKSEDFHNKISNPDIPETFYCKNFYFVQDLRFQIAGWDVSKSCSVNSATSIFMPARKCLILNYSIANQQERPPVQVKRDLESLKLTSSRVVESRSADPSKEEITQQFCTDAHPANTAAVYTIGWVAVDKLSWDSLPIELNWVKVSDK